MLKTLLIKLKILQAPYISPVDRFIKDFDKKNQNN